MAGGSHITWVPLLLSCVFLATDSRHVRSVSNVDDILSKIPIEIPGGIDPKNINVTTFIIKSCTGAQDQLALLDKQLKEATVQTRQLAEEAFGLKRKVTFYELQLAKCSSTSPAVSGCYHTELQSKLKGLLDTFENDSFLILKLLQLTSEVNALRNKIKLATVNSTETPAAMGLLQNKLQETQNELNAKRQLIERSNTNSALIFEIIVLQNQIWDLGQEELKTGESAETTEKRLKALQELVYTKIRELQGRGDAASDMLELIFMNSKIAVIEQLINVYMTESRTTAADYQKRWKKVSELLTQKIAMLIDREDDKQLTQEIMVLQIQMDGLKRLMANTRTTTESQIKELRAIWELDKKQQELLQRKMEGSDFTQAQMIIRIIGMMKELRETQIDETSSNRSLQVLIEDYTKAQAEIRELQKKLKSKTEECSGLREGYIKLKTDFDQKIEELNRSGESKPALILTVLNLHDEISALKDLIFATEDSEKTVELQKQLEEKHEQLKLKTAELEKLIANPRTVLTIIKLQNDIRNLQKATTNETSADQIKALQSRLDGLIGKIDSKDGNTPLVLKIVTLQNQVENVQRLLSDLDKLRLSEVTKLRNDLTTKRKELQKYIDELNERNRTNANLILKITDLHSQLRNLEDKGRNDNTTYTLTINQLQEELIIKRLEHDRDQAEIKKLQQKLQISGEECSGLQEKYDKTKTELEQLIEDLKKRGESKSSLILKILKLHGEVQTLTDLIATTKPENPDKMSALQKQLEDKQDELHLQTAELERLAANPRIILQIIELQNEIWNLQKTDTNSSTSNQVKDLQDRVDGLINEIGAKGDDNVKLVLQIISLQSQVEQLQGLLSNLTLLTRTQVTQLTNDLTTTKKLLQKYTNELNKNNQTNAGLVLKITDLTNQLRSIKVENQERSNRTSATIFSLSEQLKRKEQERVQDQATIKVLQDKLNQTQSQCSSLEQQLIGLQTEVDRKIKELLSKSNSVTSLALQISTLNLQLEESKRQLKNAESQTKSAELQKIIDERNKELAEKKEELQQRSPQAQRFLHIITIQNEIEKYVNVVANETNYDKIKALEDHLAQLIEGIQDEENENTKLMFKVLSQQDEISRLKKLEAAQEKAYSVTITGLQNELENIRDQIKEKSDLMNKGDKRITELSSQIMALHKKIQPLEDEIEDLKATNAETLNDMQRRLSLKEKQLQDSELRLKDSDTKNFEFIMEISDLKGKLKKAQKFKLKAKDLEETVQTQETRIKKLESTNRDLKNELSELRSCCSKVGRDDCEELQTQLQQSIDDVSRLQKQLQSKNAKIQQLQEDSEDQTRATNRLRQEYNNLEKQYQQTQALNDHLQKQLSEKDAVVNQQQKELEERTMDFYKLQEDYNKLQTEKSELEETVQELQNNIAEKEDKTIYPRKITFDPNTAHPRILLTAGNTKMSTAPETQNVLDNPGRFDADLAALGATGYSSGRQYWEVSVAGKTCYHIGMTSENAPRKGKIRYHPTNGYWTIIMNKQGQLRAIDNRPAVIRVQEAPLRLGILLDYKNGQISFYDAGSRSHMYSFAGQRFTSKIYPFVNFCVEEVESTTPIVLLTPGSVDWIK